MVNLIYNEYTNVYKKEIIKNQPLRKVIYEPTCIQAKNIANIQMLLVGNLDIKNREWNMDLIEVI